MHVLRRTPVRTLAISAALVLGLSTLAACGDDSSDGGDGGKDLSSVTFGGEAGKAPEVKFDGELVADDVESKVLIEGDGEKAESGQTVKAHVWLGNGFSQKQVLSTWETGQPENLPLGEDLSEPLKEALEGRAVGSRVAVLASAEDSFGEYGNPDLGIGNKDSVLWVVDLVGIAPKPLDGPRGKKQTPASWAPTLELDGDEPTGFDFAGTKPNGKLRSTVLVKGDGAAVKKGQSITVNYLGQVWKGKEPFDQSFNAEPANFPIGVGSVVKGWDQSLVGATVGSRMIVEIPPALGYGKEGREPNIKGTDTMYFVIDILGAS